MGSTATMVSLKEYLNTTYEPDKEFVEGVLVERNVGTLPHSVLQNLVLLFLGQFHQSHRIQVCPDARLRIDEGRHRIPDILVLERPFRAGNVVTDVPVITVEIKSPDDTFDDIVNKCFEYEALGVRNILVMDPDYSRAFLFEQSTLRHLQGPSVQLTLRSGVIDFPFAEMFAELDEDLNNQS
jgi:Uma2 family endonuclease